MPNVISLTLDKLINDFLVYLLDDGISANSIKHYKSDVTHFSGWMLFRIRSWGVSGDSLSEIIPFLSASLAHEYREYMLLNGFPSKTINRRLSSLRRLSSFLVKSHLTSADFMDGIVNVSLKSRKSQTMKPLVAEFRKKLEAEKVSHNTIKNYLSDINHFINWLESNQNNPTN